MAGQDSVTWRGLEDGGGVDRGGGAGGGQEGARLAAVAAVHRADIDRAKQPCQAGLAAVPVAPYLGDHHGVAAQFQPGLLGYPQPGDHCSVATVAGDQRPGVQNQRAHATVSLARTPRSRPAWPLSSAVSAPCSASQLARNSASASARSLLAAASASHDDNGLPACAAADRTASPRSAAHDTLVLS